MKSYDELIKLGSNPTASTVAAWRGKFLQKIQPGYIYCLEYRMEAGGPCWVALVIPKKYTKLSITFDVLSHLKDHPLNNKKNYWYTDNIKKESFTIQYFAIDDATPIPQYNLPFYFNSGWTAIGKQYLSQTKKVAA